MFIAYFLPATRGDGAVTKLRRAEITFPALGGDAATGELPESGNERKKFIFEGPI